MKQAGATFQEIHISLDNGALGELPEDESNKLVVSNGAIATLREEIARLQAIINRQEGEISVLTRILEEKEELLFEARHKLKLLTDGKG